MESNYKNGLIIMKAYPFHKGHASLINFGLKNCDILHIIISHNKSQTIPGIDRYDAIQEMYIDNKRVKVYQFEDDDYPQYDHECETLDEFYSYWVPAIYKLVDDLDVVFTSEDYGDEFAKYLGVKHLIFNKERDIITISGTDIRNDKYKNWDYMTDTMKNKLITRVAIMGPESVGKSTLTKRLASYFNTNFVVEYGRIVYESNGNKVEVNDFIPISEGRQSLEDWLVKKANKIIFCDTEDITTYLFLKMYCYNYEEEEKWFLKTLDSKKNYDLYILLKPDCDAVQDGTRVFLNEREEHYLEIKKELDNRGCEYIEIGGYWDDRFFCSIDYIKSIFNI